MDQTHNTPTPQEPKKSFWAKLFGGGKPASPSPTVQPTEPVNSDTPNTQPVADVPAETSAPAVPPANNSWNLNPVEPQEAPTETSNEALPSPAETSVPPVPTWRDTPAGEVEPLIEVPVPPSDPMVTPVVPPAEAASDEQVVVPLETVEPPAPNPNSVPLGDNEPQSSQSPSEQDSLPPEDHSSITPPER